MAYTTTDLDNINSAITSGVRRVRLNGREQEFMHSEELFAIRDKITEELNRTNTAITRPRSFRSRTRKGL